MIVMTRRVERSGSKYAVVIEVSSEEVTFDTLAEADDYISEQIVSPEHHGLLSYEEFMALELLGMSANVIAKICGGGDYEHDWAEAALHIHNLQHMVMAQAACRAYPKHFRPLGQSKGQW